MKILRFYLSVVLISCSLFGYSTSLFKDINNVDHTIKITQLLDSSISLRNVSLEQSVLTCKKAIYLAEETNDPDFLSKTYKEQGINFFYTSNYDSAFVYYQKAIEQFQKIGSRIDVGKVIGNIGLLYYSQTEYDKALIYFLKNLKIYEEENYEQGLGALYLNLGNLYFHSDNSTTAKEYFQLALEHIREYNNPRKIAGVLCNLGIIAQEEKDYATSLNLYKQSLQKSSKTNDALFKARLFHNIGYLYHSQKKLDSAFYYVKKSESIKTQIGNKTGIVGSKLELGRILIDQKKYHQALKYLKEAYFLAEEIKESKWKPEILSFLAKANHLLGNYKDAFLNQKEIIQISDSLNVVEANLRFEELAANYEADKKEKELELLQQKSLIQNLEIDKKNAWIISLLVVIILGVVAILVSMRINRLRADHKIMDLRQKVLLTQMNPHFLFNSLTAIQSFILDEKNDEANNYLSQLAYLVRNILESSREEFVPLRRELQTLKDYIGLQKLRFENDIRYKFEINNNIDQDQILVPPMLAQPFIENALVHGMLRGKPDAEIQVKISTSNNNETLRFEIKDNGIGIDQAKKNRGDIGHQSLATSIAMDRLKIYNFKSSKKMNFEITDLKNINPKLSGTLVTFSIPITSLN